MLMEIGQVDKQNGYTPQFRDPASLSRRQTIDDRAGNIGAQRIFCSLRDDRFFRLAENGGGFIEAFEASTLGNGIPEFKFYRLGVAIVPDQLPGGRCD